MVANKKKSIDLLRSYKGQFIVVVAPNYGCCQCGNRLKPHFGGLSTRILPFPCPLIFSVCDSCQSPGFKEMTRRGKNVKLISPSAIRALLADEDRILGFAQMTHWGDGVLLEPYPIRGN
jgi:hypothetical protein